MFSNQAGMPAKLMVADRFLICMPSLLLAYNQCRKRSLGTSYNNMAVSKEFTRNQKCDSFVGHNVHVGSWFTRETQSAELFMMKKKVVSVVCHTIFTSIIIPYTEVAGAAIT